MYFWITEASGERSYGGSSPDLPLARMFIRAEDDVLSSSDLCARWQNGVEIQK